MGTQRIVSRLGDESARIFEGEAEERPAMEVEEGTLDVKKTKNAQKADLQFYADQTQHKTYTFAKYSGSTIKEEEQKMKEFDDKENTQEVLEAKALDERPIYFYHPDHLETTNALTDANGTMYQFFLNLPFGESMAEQSSQSYYKTPFKFNGKELDESTGLYYYGARYYDPSLSIWMSVDPLAEKYPNISSYAYCAQNPIANKEIDGRYFIFVPGLGHSNAPGYFNSPYVTKYDLMINDFDRSRGGLGGVTVSGFRGGSSTLMNRFHDGLYTLWWGSSVRGNIRNDRRAMNIINHTSANYARIRAAGDNFDIMGTSQGTVSTAQAAVGMLKDPSSFGLPEDFKIDNLYLAGSMVDGNSELGLALQSYEESGQIGNLQYLSATGDTIEGTAGTSRRDAFGNVGSFIDMVMGEMKRTNAMGENYTPLHPHVRAAQNLPNNPSSGCSSSACEVRQAIQTTYKE